MGRVAWRGPALSSIDINEWKDDSVKELQATFAYQDISKQQNLR
jgi:hypothetical protein